MKISNSGLNFIKDFEKLMLTAYNDGTGTWTIGYGHTKGVLRGQTITEKQALEFLAQDVAWVEKAINSAVSNLSQNQFDAFASLIFNCGAGVIPNFTPLMKANPNDPAITLKFSKYVYSKGVKLNGLASRRAKEIEMYKKKVQ